MTESTLDSTENLKHYRAGAVWVSYEEHKDAETHATNRRYRIRLRECRLEVPASDAQDLLRCLQDALGEAQHGSGDSCSLCANWEVGAFMAPCALCSRMAGRIDRWRPKPDAKPANDCRNCGNDSCADLPCNRWTPIKPSDASCRTCKHEPIDSLSDPMACWTCIHRPLGRVEHWESR